MRVDRGRIHVRLSDFLRTGKIGPIGIGSTRADIVKAFGVADGFNRPRGANSEMIWFYGSGASIEFGFLQTVSALDRVFYIQIENADCHRGFSGAGRLAFFDEGFRIDGTMKWDIERFCRIRGVRFVQIRSSTGIYGLLTEGGVCAWAGDEDTEGELFFDFQTFITDGPHSALAARIPVGFNRLHWDHEQLTWPLGRSTRRRRTI